MLYLWRLQFFSPVTFLSALIIGTVLQMYQLALQSALTPDFV